MAGRGGFWTGFRKWVWGWVLGWEREMVWKKILGKNLGRIHVALQIWIGVRGVYVQN